MNQTRALEIIDLLVEALREISDGCIAYQPGHVNFQDNNRTKEQIRRIADYAIARVTDDLDRLETGVRCLKAERDELLEALKAIVAAMDPSISGSPNSPLEKARTAIAKATGAT